MGTRAQGFFVHTVLALDAETRASAWLSVSRTLCPSTSAQSGETKAQRKKRVRESQVWERSIQAIGPVPERQKWIYVGDRGSDIYTFWQTCELLGYDFVVRVAASIAACLSTKCLKLRTPKCSVSKPWHALCQCKVAESCLFPALRQRPARDALVQISWQEVRIQPPVNGAALSKTEMTAWVVRVWEPEPPEGVEALEWILVTTAPVHSVEDAWERVKWYKWRWLLEDFHKVLKTGCGIEVRRQQTVASMWNLLGILTPMAMRLLWLRQTAQQAPHTPATEVVSQEVIYVVTKLDNRPGAMLTANDLWRTIAMIARLSQPQV